MIIKDIINDEDMKYSFLDSTSKLFECRKNDDIITVLLFFI